MRRGDGPPAASAPSVRLAQRPAVMLVGRGGWPYAAQALLDNVRDPYAVMTVVSFAWRGVWGLHGLQAPR